MSIELFHHPYSRASTVVWMLEEVGAPYTLRFVNIMQGDFHLHLKAGAVSSWERTESEGSVALHARDSEGKSFGLVLRGPAAAFAEVPHVDVISG